MFINPSITSNTKLSDLLECARTYDQDKADYRQDPRAFTVNNAGQLTTSPDPLFGSAQMTPVTFTRHALKQASGKLGAAYGMPSLPTDYLLTLQNQFPELFADNMNGAISRLENSKDWFVRTYRQECRAVLSGEYLKFDNSDMLKLLNDVLSQDGTEHRISTRSYVTPDNMVTDVLFKDIHTGDDSRGNGGFSLGVRIRNGEIGDWTGGVYPIVKRTSCDNSIAIDDRTMSFVFKHYGRNTETSKRVMLNAAIGEILPHTVQIIDKLLQAEEKDLPKFSDVVNGLAMKHGWSEEVKGTIFAGTEARFNLAGLVNGITYAAHAAQMPPEQMTELEFLGGALLFDTRGAITREAESIFAGAQAREERKQAKADARAQAQTRNR